MQKKLFLGYKLRRLREQRGLTQAALAKQLELSPSYLNQIENNQRPLTLPLFCVFASIFEIDLATFVEDEEARLVSDLREALADPLFTGGAPSTVELRNPPPPASPELARRALVLHHAYQEGSGAGPSLWPKHCRARSGARPWPVRISLTKRYGTISTIQIIT